MNQNSRGFLRMPSLSLVLLAAACPLLYGQNVDVPGGASGSQPGVHDSGAKTPPAVRTARLTWFQGDLQVERADNTAPAEDASGAAVLNMPLAEGSRLVTGEGSEAEIEFEDGSIARLTPGTAISLDSLAVEGEDAKTRLSLLSGLAYFELRHAPTAAYTIAAGTVLATPADNVVIRIALEEPPAVISVLSGTLTVTAENDPEAATVGFTATVHAGESLRADLNDATRYFLNPQVADATWDMWNLERDNQAVADAATRTTARDGYAGTQGYGWSDLDAAGNWYSVTNADGSTSELWQPAVAAVPGAAPADAANDADAFDPYGDGAFVYSGGGYLWASGYSWGWLPYRCGRWNFYPLFGWGWSPDRFCRTYGYGGGGGINIGRHPRQYRLPHVPPVNGFHPIVRVHTTNLPLATPRRIEVGPVRIAGAVANPLQPISTSSVPANGLVGGSLYREFPILTATHRPVWGTMAPVSAESKPSNGVIVAPGSVYSPGIVRIPAGTYARPTQPYRAPTPPPRPAPAPRAEPAPAAPSRPR